MKLDRRDGETYMESITRALRRGSRAFEGVQSCEESLDEVEDPLPFPFDLEPV